MFLLRHIEQLLYSIRDFLWSYPERLFIDKHSLYNQFRSTYHALRPLSHYLMVAFITFLVVTITGSNVSAMLRINSDTLIEGVIVGLDEQGDVQEISRINPLINSNIQLERDIIELIYESLISVNQSGESTAALADYGELDKGRLYRFKLREGMLWSDGQPITTADVEATFNLLQQLEGDPTTSTLYSRAATKMEIIILDDLTFEFKLNSVIPGFFEAISYKILPAHLLSDVNTDNIVTSDPLINRNPVGSGRYKINSVSDDTITLSQNPNYHGEHGSIKKIVFRMYPDESSAVEALRGGQIHTLSGISTDSVRNLQSQQNIELIGSNIIYSQYWALFFNLNEEGPAAFDDVAVRRAISSAVNRDFVIDNLLGYATEAIGPIPESSWAYTAVPTYRFDKSKASEILEDAGWRRPAGSEIREKDGKKLEFTLLLIENSDRVKIAQSIQKDLLDVGIRVNVVSKEKNRLVSENLVPRVFDMILYGVQTFIDPDRYELFHSSQIDHPGLNISSYASKNTVLTVQGGEQIRIPEVDDLLDDARRLVDESDRKKKYELFQRTIGSEVPAVFLFHPAEVYAVNKRVRGVSLERLNSLENRFDSIRDWFISTESS
ncbi:MAG: peptide ABC transporter substrate-binding protein [Candidatus Dojkabacteria bacterium]|nr:MAG: peptide ABC transporter substrate-binding protein [Candidatus Dojkabacteria bacterium]